MKRRDFLNWVGTGALASFLPVALAACTPNTGNDVTDDAAGTEAEPTADAPRTDGFTVVGTVTDLDQNGSLLDKGTAASPALIIRDPANADSVIAVNPTCTHQGCDVQWSSGDAVFACPCHGSQFAPDGSVTTGPASTALGSYEAKIEGDQVLVKTS